MKNKKAYILYQYDQFNDDYLQVMEYYSINELVEDNEKELNIVKGAYNKHIYQYISEDLDHIKRLINDKYLIIKEDLQERLG